MNLINTYLKTIGTKGLNIFFTSQSLMKLEVSEVRDFIKLYLNKPYVNNNDIIDYLNIALNKKAFTAAELDELLVNSKFFNTMPESDIYSFLKRFGFLLKIATSNLPKFITKCTRRLHNLDQIINLINTSSAINIEAAKQIIVSSGNIETIIRCENKITRESDRLGLGSAMINSDMYALEEFKAYCIGTDASVFSIADWIADYINSKKSPKERNSALDLLIEFANTEEEYPKEDNKLIDIKRKQKYTGYRYYAYNISINPKYTPEINRIILKKLLHQKNYKFLCACLSFIDDTLNHEIINSLLACDSDTIITLLSCVSDKDLLYTLNTLLKKDASVLDEVMSKLCQNARFFPVGRIDIILDVLFNNSSYRFKREDTILLIECGSKYTLDFFRNYDYQPEERKRILDFYKDNNMVDYCTLYGDFLLSGNKAEIFHFSSAAISSLHLERSKKEE